MQRQLVTDPQRPLSVASASIAEVSAANQSADSDHRMIRRNRDEAYFKPQLAAMTRAFLAACERATSVHVRNAGQTTDSVVALLRHQQGGAGRELELAKRVGIKWR